MTEKLKGIVRICNTDLKGTINIGHALTKIKGVGFSFANAVCNQINMERNKKIGALTEEEIKKIEEVVNNPKDLPKWLYNRRNDFDTGEDLHLTTTKLNLQKEFDIKRVRKIKSYKGMRHSYGLPVRGQRTRAHFRKGASVGVQKKSAKMRKGK